MLRRIALGLAIALALICMFLFYSHYWQYRELFDANGRYFDAKQGGVFDSQSGIGWGSLTIVFCLIAVALFPRKR